MTDLIIKDSGVIAKAEIDSMITTAKTYPRDVRRSIDNAVMLATLDEATAQSCFYCLPRKEKDGTKKEIKGGSIRLAEIMANSWGNLHAATRIVENDGKHITAQSVAWDLESNVKITVDNKVSIVFGKGANQYTANADMQTVLANAAAAKALRNAIFKVVPKALVDRVLEKAMQFAIGDQKSMNSKVDEVIQKLGKMGIDKARILEYYGYESISQITAEDFKSLIGVGTALKEGYIKVDDVFTTEQAEQEGTASGKLAQLIARKKGLPHDELGEVHEQQNDIA